MKKIKLAFVTQFPADTNLPLGGVEAVSLNLVRSLAAYPELDIQVITLCAGAAETSLESWNNTTIHRLPKPKGSELLNALSKSKVLISNYLLKLKPDIIHAHDTYGIMVNSLSIPKVFTVHGFIYGDTLFSNGSFKWLRSKLWEHFEKSSWAKLPNIISISPYVRERVSLFSPAAIYDIDNPISDHFFTLERKEKKGVIFTSAVICPRKNTLILVKAVAILVKAGYDVELRVAGSVSDERYAQEMSEWIAEHDLVKHIKLLGRISTQRVMEELQAAAVYALASFEENSPMGIEEAMAAGIPVVTSNRCGMPYMVRNNETGYLINPFDENNIADKFRRILDDDNLRLAMGEKAKELALDLYHSENVARRTYAVYRDLLDS
ncbi:glycosyltransferase family 4 protein [Psychromonas aquimarina]|uniref:glycosyltransferase family 4 protein n=1 Tax=Psychromonas aquimarina TaxID=444919 RepID=UPI0003F933E7|nr:glycosyltransferase family 4 protein [Psychromonas aquimarina]